MQKKSNINWWAVLAVIIIGGSVGFVGTAYFKKKQESQNKQELAVQAKDSVNRNSYSNEADPSDIETNDSEDVEPDDDDIKTDKDEPESKLTLKEAQSIVLGGGKNDKIPDDCMTVVNGKSNTYGKFRQTVGSYSIVRVEDLDYNEKNEVTKVVITALNTAPDSKSEPDLKPKVDDEKKRLAAEAAAERKRLAAEEAARKKAADDEKKRLAAEAAAEKKRLAAEEAARKKAADDEKKRLAAEAAAEKKRLAAEEAARKKAADAEKKRLAAEEDARKKADQAQKLNLLKSDAQGIVASGRTDSRFPDNCKVVGNGVNTTYKQFRTNVANKSYESVKVVSVTPDKNGNASQIKVTVVRPDPNIIKKEKEKLEKEEKERKEKEELARRNNELKNEVQGIVAKGQRSSKVPDDCTILVNGRNKKDYQSFRMGVNLRAYSNVKVTSVSTDSKGNVTQINVSATESKDSE